MNTLRIPDSLKQALRSCYESDPDEDGEITEKETENTWSVSYSYSEWSGYHDESNYHSYSTIVLDHEPAMPNSQEWHLTEMLPQNREFYAKLFHGYDIKDLYQISKSCDYPEDYSETIIKLDCSDPDYQYTRPLWVIRASSTCR